MTTPDTACFDVSLDPLERLLACRDRHPTGWPELDSTYLNGGCELARVGRACEARFDLGAQVRRWMSTVGCSPATCDDVAAGGRPARLRRAGRHYALALLALVDALAAEPPWSPLSAVTSHDDLRAAAFLIARETACAGPDPVALGRRLQEVDRRLGSVRIPLRSTGYLLARDELRGLLDSPVVGQAAGTP